MSGLGGADFRGSDGGSGAVAIKGMDDDACRCAVNSDRDQGGAVDENTQRHCGRI